MGDGSNPQVLAANTKALLPQFLIDAIRFGVVIKYVQLGEIINRFTEVSVSYQARISGARFAHLCQTPTQLLLGGDDGDCDLFRGESSQSLTNLWMAAEDQAKMIRIKLPGYYIAVG